MRTLSYLFLINLSLIVSACSNISTETNQALEKKADKPLSSEYNAKISHNRSDDLSLLLTFSGGGTRSAALSYGVLEALRDTKITINGKQRRILDEIDLISSVSGGSFTSAYYGLFGDRLFEDFEDKFLNHRVQNELLKRSLYNPKAWFKLAQSVFNRSDLAADYYNQILFEQKTFADIRPDAPTIVINATDLSLGQGFSFTGYHFNWICSNLESYPISRAVTASAAVPVLFSPITLKNHAHDCQTTPLVWRVQKRNERLARQRNKTTYIPKRQSDALHVKYYRDNPELKYLHLVDGGVADNLGIRSIIDIVSFHNDNMWRTMQTYGMHQSKKVVFISVNAASLINPIIGSVQATPSTVNVLDATTTVQSNKYNIDTMDLLRSQFPKWKKQVQTGRCKKQKNKDCTDIDFQLIEINLEDLNIIERAELGIVPTALELPRKTIRQLKTAGKSLLERSEGFQDLLKDN